jgi:hypothetical protein
MIILTILDLLTFNFMVLVCFVDFMVQVCVADFNVNFNQYVFMTLHWTILNF